MMEDKDMARIELKEQDVEEIVGGAFNYYFDPNGVKSCYVDGVGDYACNAEAVDRYTVLKLQHKAEHWSAQQYVDVLLAEGLFWYK